jgi:hypothetical protein
MSNTPIVTRGAPDPNDTQLSYPEKMILSKSPLTLYSKYILAIEDASEVAKNYIQKPGVFEKILKDMSPSFFTGEFIKNKRIAGNSQVNISQRFPKSNELAHVALVLEEGGHYSSAVVNPEQKVVRLFDSMCSTSGPHTYFDNMKSIYERSYPGYNIKLVNSNSYYQPSGGFTMATEAEFKRILTKTMKTHDIPTKNINFKRAFEVHQYDPMSQHHFCYIEGLVFLAKEMLGTSLGPHGNSNMTDRLIFIKQVLWGLLQKYVFTPAIKSTKKYKILKNNFQFILDVKGSTVKHGFTIPGPNYTYELRKFHLPDVTKTTPLKEVFNPPEGPIAPRRLFN